MKEPVLATAANAVDHAVERRVLLVDWIDLASFCRESQVDPHNWAFLTFFVSLFG